MKKIKTLKYLIAILLLSAGCNGRSQTLLESKVAEAKNETKATEISTNTSNFKITVTIDTLTITTTHIDAPAKCVVAVPAACLDSETVDANYPVVYLLNGFSGNHTDWSRNTDLAALADSYGYIIVCPDGRDSWYWDSPVKENMQMESYIMEDLIPYIDSHYPTAGDNARAITGLSMGGHGALYLGMRHPEKFTAAASMSGGVDITKFPNRWAMDTTLGKFSLNPIRWKEHSVMTQASKIKDGDLAIYFDCGEEDFFYKVNCSLDSTLTSRGISHEFHHRPGKHSWKYWVESLPHHLDFFKTQFEKK